MNKFFANIICCFVPKKEWRRKLRAALTRDRFAELEAKIDIISRNVDFANSRLASPPITQDKFAKLETKIDTVSRNIDVTNSRLKNPPVTQDKFAKLEAKIDTVSRNEEKTAGSIEKIEKSINKPLPPPKPSLFGVHGAHWVRKFEGTWLNRLKEELEQIDMRRDYLRLVSGLDYQSRLIVNRILARLRYAINNPGNVEHVPLFPDETEAVNHILQNFYPNIVELASDCFWYDGYFLPRRSFEVPVFWDRWTLPSIRNLECIRNKDFIDAGAFIGDSAIVLSDFTEGKVHAFEPATENYNTMLKTIEMNGRKNIVPVHKGLGRNDGEEAMFLSGSATSFRLNDKQSSEVETAGFTSVDVYVAQNNLNVGLIKTDVEGFEQDLLWGAEKTIREKRPVLLISIYHTLSDFFHIKPLLESWDLGYKFRIVKPQIRSLFLETMLIAEPE